MILVNLLRLKELLKNYMIKKRTLAIIPARSGSKRLKNKNLLKIKNKPLIYYTILEALKSKLIDYVLVSTDSKKIAKTSIKYGANVPFIRPKNISRDKTEMIKVLKHAITFLEKKNLFFDYILLLQPTSPLRKKKHIEEIIKCLNKNSSKANSIYSVTPTVPKAWSGDLNTSLKMKNFKFKNKTKKQNYKLNGALYIFKSNYLKKTRILSLEKTYGYIMSQKYSIDIDYLYQFKICKLIIEKNEKYFL